MEYAEGEWGWRSGLGGEAGGFGGGWELVGGAEESCCGCRTGRELEIYIMDLGCLR